jgi:hypothetical protein
MRSLFLFPALCLAAALSPAETLIDTDFSGAYQSVSKPPVAGALPRGWHDNSVGKIAVSYSQMREEQRTFLRADAKNAADGWCQFVAPLPRFDSEAYLRLTVTMRNPDGLAIAMGVRKSGQPFKFVWEKTGSFSPQWKDYTWYGHVPKLSYDTGLYIVIHGAGRLDISKLRLEEIPLDELRQSVTDKKAAQGPKNLVRISRFPLGLQSGWSLYREYSDEDDVRIETDRQTTGPSGSPALHISAIKFMQLYSAPFAVPEPLEVHTASVYLRGHGYGKLVAVAAQQPLASQNFELNGRDWQRVSVRFKPDLLGRPQGVRIEGSGDFWLDALQVERGAEPTAYESPGACEVSLATDSPIRVQFDDEAAVVRYSVSGRAQGATLRTKVVNLYGEEQKLPAVNLGSGFLNEGTLKYGVFPAKPLGSFRIEGWVEDKQGRRISPYNELVVNRLHRPHYWMKDAPNSPFGTHILSTTRHILMAKAAGVNWTRLHDAGTSYAGWYNVERQPGQWTFHDEPIERYRKYGMKILGTFATAPPWASVMTKAHDAGPDRYYEPRNLEAFANYVRVISERYKGVIDSYGMWNEPFNNTFWPASYDEAKQKYLHSAHPQADFVTLMKTAYGAAKSVDPHLTILGVETYAGSSGKEWTQGIADANGLPYCDVICYHQYTKDAVGYPGDAAEAGFKSGLAPFLDDHGHAPKPVWMTEGCSVDARTGNGIYHYTLPYEEEEDVPETSDRLCRFTVGLLAQGVQKVFLYSMHCQGWFGSGSSDRVLVTEEGYLHPSAAAYSAMAWFLEDKKFAKSSSPASGVTAYVFEGAGGAVTVLSPLPSHAPYAIPAGAYDLYGNPVPKGQALGKRLVYVTSVHH